MVGRRSSELWHLDWVLGSNPASSGSSDSRPVGRLTSQPRALVKVFPPLRFVQAFLLYLPTTFILPNSGLILFALFSVLIFDPSFNRKDRLYFLFIAGVCLNALLGIVVDQQFPDSLFVNNGLLGAVILIFGYLAARSLNDTVWKIVLLFLVIEVVCIYLQFALGIRFFFPQQEVVTTTTEFRFTQDVQDIDLLYFIRPMGLSGTSTIAGAKILLAFVLTFMLDLRPRTRWLLSALFVGAAILNFKRSSLLAFSLLIGILLVLDLRKSGWRFRHTFASAVFLSILSFYATQIIGQFTRESAVSLGDISFNIIVEQLSGRAYLWNETTDFIGDHLFFGNYSERLILSTGQYPHSSYMSLLATNGLFLTTVMVTFIVARVAHKPAVLIFLAPVLIAAAFQENLFWYISLFDQFVLYLLLVREPSRYWFNPFPRRTDRRTYTASQMAPA